MNREGALTILAVAGLGQLLISLLLFLWGRFVGRRRRGTWWRRAAWLPWVACAVAMTTLTLSLSGMIRSFEVVATTEAANKATVLADGISSAMAPLALGIPVAWLLYTVSFVTFLVGTLRKSPGVSP
jgi:hypothetical protein